MSEGCIERLVDGYHRGAWCTNRVTECIHYLHLPPGHPLAPVPALALANPPPPPHHPQNRRYRCRCRCRGATSRHCRDAGVPSHRHAHAHCRSFRLRGCVRKG